MKTSEASNGKLGWNGPFLWSALFIFMWSSGYVAGKLGLPYAGPFTLLFIRFAVAAAILLFISALMKAQWPKSKKDLFHLIVVGILIQVLQFSGVYYGLSLGVSAGVSALIIGLMPVTTAICAVWFLKEKVSKLQMVGLALGVLGVCSVVAHKVNLESGSILGYLTTFLALGGITLGTIYQKKFCGGMDLRTGGCIQLTSAAILVGILSWRFEQFQVNWSHELIISTAWLSLVNSIGAISLLFFLMRRGEASRVASLFYLVPSVAALMGYAVLSETISITQAIGFLVSASGVYLATRK